MMRRSIVAVPLLAAALMNLPAPSYAQDIPAEYQQVLSTAGPAEKLASGFKAAVNELGKHGGN